MVLALTYFAVILAFFLFALKTNRGLGSPGVVAFGVYLVCGVAMLALVYLDNATLHIVPTAYFTGMLLLFLLPHVSRGELTDQAERPVLWTDLHTLGAFITMLPCYYSIAFSLPSVVKNLQGPIEATRFLVYSGQGIGTGNLYPTLASGLWPLAFVFAVYAALAGRSVFYVAILLGASLAGAINGLSSLGRSGMVYWALFSLILLSLTWPIIRVRLGEKIIYLKITVGTVIVGVALCIGLLAYGRNLGLSTKDSRTGMTSRSSQLVYSLSSYTGQSLINFQDFWVVNDDFGMNLYGKKIFPIYCGILERLGVIGDYDASETNIIYKPVYDAVGLEHAVFNGFQRELIMDFGKVGAMVAGVLYAVVSVIVRRRYERAFTFSRILFSSFMISVPVFGIFFFSYGEMWANITIAAVLVCGAVFAVAEGRLPEKEAQAPA